MTIKKLKTNKLFYKKWPYKIVCTLPGAYAVSLYRGDKFDEWIVNPLKKTTWWFGPPIVKTEVSELRDAILPFIDDIKLRGEGRHLSIYSDNKILVDSIIVALNKWITHICEPSSDKELEYMTANSHKKIIRDELPHGLFTYKVAIKHKFNSNKRIQFGKWITNYPENIRPTKSTKRWLDDETKWNYNPYLYVSDSKTLAMVCMYLGSDVGDISEFILRTSINTV